MALAQTDLPELKRFTFFVSRRFEEGRERFRLHMGFFASQAEAEEWLGVVRDIYPGAWAGEAPGKKLRARAAEAAATQARHAVGSAEDRDTCANTRCNISRARCRESRRARSLRRRKYRHWFPLSIRPQQRLPGPRRQLRLQEPRGPLRRNPQKPRHSRRRSARRHLPRHPREPRHLPRRALLRRPRLPPGRRLRARRRCPLTATGAPRCRVGQRPAVRSQGCVRQTCCCTGGWRQPQRRARRPTGAPTVSKWTPQARAAQQTPKKAIFADSNVKEVLAALDTPQDATGQTRVMQAPGARSDAADDSTLTDTQVLRFLEIRRDDESAARSQPVPQADAAAESGISLLKPDDTGTRRALKEAVSHNEPVSFAVQLQWSVQPVELDKVPPLAIFSAYTLYSVEGSREGRKWYGLRLGFFNDAISAKQVAYYVRSEFTSVAVVPVSPQERGRATEDNQRFSGAGGTAQAPRRAKTDEFKLIDSDDGRGRRPAAGSRAKAARARPRQRRSSAPAAAQPAPAQPAPAPAASKSGGKVGARERRTPQTLEETLEILGANELAIDTGTGESLNDTGVRHLRVEIQKNTPFSRLLERLSERVRKA